MERFTSKYKVNPETGCFEWTACRNNYGYGMFFYEGKVQSAHRVAWKRHKGAIPPGMNVLHRCDNPRCVNDDHLFLGTQADNNADMIEKGRSMVQKPGWRSPTQKLTVSQTAAIAASDLPTSILVRKYGISKSRVQQLRQVRA